MLFIACLLTTLAAIIGIPDNLPGILLYYLGIISIVFAILHNVLEAVNNLNILDPV